MKQQQLTNAISNIVKSIKPTKSQICRFYLRGLCVFKSSDCYFSHGVWDLIYKPWSPEQKIDYDYSKLQKEVKQPTFKGQRTYKNLFDYQSQKMGSNQYSLSQINSDRQIRNLIRNQMHAEMFNDFMDLLRCYYSDALFTQDFLLRQFTRVGFNKTMSIIKLNHICAYVCDPPSSRYFKISLVMPPHVNKQVNYILPCSTQQQNLQFYRECYEQFKQKAQDFNESTLKKYLFGVTRPTINLLPLNIFLKNKKMNFTAFFKQITNDQSLVVQVDEKTLLISAAKFIQSNIQNQQGYCTWADVFKFLGQQFKVNNANTTNPLKPILINDGYLFLNFPMIQFITNQKRVRKQWKKWQLDQGNKLNKNSHKTVCPCEYKKMYEENQLMFEIINFQQKLPIKESFDIFDMQSLLKCAGTILNSKVLAVDLEGRLRKNGYIQMIQINTGLNTFLIDIHGILLKGDMETFQLCKKIIRNAFCNPNILKIFHDCRHDSLVLHQIMNTCIINIFDTSAIQTLIGQLNTYKEKKSSKEILKFVTNVITPGLNDLLKKYNAPHGLNQNKEWFHQLWKKGKTQLFEQRPLHPEYREYCIKDVLDLPYLCEKMSENICPIFSDWLCSHYVKAGFDYTLEQK